MSKANSVYLAEIIAKLLKAKHIAAQVEATDRYPDIHISRIFNQTLSVEVNCKLNIDPMKLVRLAIHGAQLFSDSNLVAVVYEVRDDGLWQHKSYAEKLDRLTLIKENTVTV